LTINVTVFNFLVLLDIDKMAYSASFMVFHQCLHMCIEPWSRMGATVQWALVDHGAFHLLLNEFHTASTTMVSFLPSNYIFKLDVWIEYVYP